MEPPTKPTNTAGTRTQNADPSEDSELPPSYDTIDAPPPTFARTIREGGGPATASASAIRVHRQFPPEFNLYSSNALAFKKLVIGETQNTPIYSVTLHSGWSGNPDVVLHTSASPDSPPMATGLFKSFANEIIVTLPPLTPTSQPAEKKVKGSLLSLKYSFSVEVPAGPGGKLVLEPFEWRNSSGDEVRPLGGLWGQGKKLVRLGPPPRADSTASTTSDGKEIVAVFNGAKVSFTKRLAFKFTGAGESGELGERWAVMAVISALSIWEHGRRSRNHS